jgi:competence protein ComGC
MVEIQTGHCLNVRQRRYKSVKFGQYSSLVSMMTMMMMILIIIIIIIILMPKLSLTKYYVG